MVDGRAPLAHGRVNGIEDAHISRHFMRSSRNTAKQGQEDRSSHAAGACWQMKLYRRRGRYLWRRPATPAPRQPTGRYSCQTNRKPCSRKSPNLFRLISMARAFVVDSWQRHQVAARYRCLSLLVVRHRPSTATIAPSHYSVGHREAENALSFSPPHCRRF